METGLRQLLRFLRRGQVGMPSEVMNFRAINLKLKVIHFKMIPGKRKSGRVAEGAALEKQ